MEEFALTSPLQYQFGKNDFYPTPRWVTEALIDDCQPPPGIVLEPAAGDGAIARVLKERCYPIYGIDIREETRSDLSAICDEVFVCDFLKVKNKTLFFKPVSIITNPPFSLAIEFCWKCLELEAKYVALLLPVGSLGGNKQEWKRFWLKHPPTKMRPMSRRPKFTDKGTDRTGVCWFIWEGGEPAMDIVPL